MSDNTLNMLSLEKELTSIEEDALADERESVERNYALLEQERKEISIPFPEVHPYDTGIDYEDISDIQYKKGQNQPAWDRIAVVDRYLTASKLFVGHCLMQGGANYYIIDHPSLASKNQITPEQCYALKGDKLVLERLAQKTLGDPDAYTDVTFCDIISEIQQEAEIEGALKEKKKNEIIMEERDKANDAIIQQMMASKRELQSDLVHHLNESLRNAKKELEIQQQRLDEVEVSVKRFKKRLLLYECPVFVAASHRRGTSHCPSCIMGRQWPGG